jgi:hypothetical protein
MGTPVKPRFTGIPAHDVAGTAKTVLRIGGPTFVLRNLFSLSFFFPELRSSQPGRWLDRPSRPRGG